MEQSDGQLKYEAQLDNDFDEISCYRNAGQAAPSAPLLAQPQPESELTFNLGAALPVHGQKHIWDNISGDILDKLQHFKSDLKVPCCACSLFVVTSRLGLGLGTTGAAGFRTSGSTGPLWGFALDFVGFRPSVPGE